MGISGLLPFLKKASRPANIKEFKGCTVAIDSYCWLHRGAFACAEKLAMGEPTDQYVFYCMKYVNSLLSFGIKPVMVFDGCHLPSKKEVEKTRRERRDVNRKKAAQFLREGKRAEARECLTKCIDITAHMALELMNACRDKGVDCIVAPYEADPQLAYLNKVGIAQVIITEDSDLVLFGCERVMYKMDFAGNGILVETSKLNQAMELKSDCYTFEKFRYMCILSGCDYQASLPGIGLGKATKLFRLTRQTDMKMVLKKLPTILKMGSLTVSSEYIDGFFRANNTFLYQLVFDPRSRKVVPLTAYGEDVDQSDLKYAGSYIPHDKALQIAWGNIDINTGQQIADFDPDIHKPRSQGWNVHGRDAKDMLHMLSIWSRNYRPMPKLALQHLGCHRAVERNTTKGQEVTVKLPPKLMRDSPGKRARELEAEQDEQSSRDDLLSAYSGLESPPPVKRIKVESSSWAEQQDLPCGTAGQKDGLFVDAGSPQVCRAQDNERSDMLSPTKAGRNRFALDAGSPKKPRFSLNAAKLGYGSGTGSTKPSTEVKSRFFKTKDPHRMTNFFTSLDKEHDLVTSPPKQSAEDDRYSGGEHIKNTPHLEEDGSQSEHKDNVEEDRSGKFQRCHSAPDIKRDTSARSSPYGSFGSGKLDKFRSKFSGGSPGASLQKSSALTKQFKPVKPTASALKSGQCCERETATPVITDGPTSPLLADVDDAINSSNCDTDTASQKSLYSMDSSLLLFSQNDLDLEQQAVSLSSYQSTCSLKEVVGDDLERQPRTFPRTSSEPAFPKEPPSLSRWTLPKNQSVSNLSTNRDSKASLFYLHSSQKDVCSSQDSDVTDGDTSSASICSQEFNNQNVTSSSFTSRPSSQTSRTGLTGKPQRLGSARKTGLSRNTKKGPAAGQASTENQSTIKSFLSSYGFSKKSQEKIPGNRKPLSPSKDNILAGQTPEADGLYLPADNMTAQRKLHMK